MSGFGGFSPVSQWTAFEQHNASPWQSHPISDSESPRTAWHQDSSCSINGAGVDIPSYLVMKKSKLLDSKAWAAHDLWNIYIGTQSAQSPQNRFVRGKNKLHEWMKAVWVFRGLVWISYRGTVRLDTKAKSNHGWFSKLTCMSLATREFDIKMESVEAMWWERFSLLWWWIRKGVDESTRMTGGRRGKWERSVKKESKRSGRLR